MSAAKTPTQDFFCLSVFFLLNYHPVKIWTGFEPALHAWQASMAIRYIIRPLNGHGRGRTCVLRVKSPLHNRFATYPQCFARDSNPHLRLRSTTLRCQTQLSEVLLSQVKSRLFSVPNPVRDNPCYSLLLAVHPFLLANLWHLPPFGECSRESSKA